MSEKIIAVSMAKNEADIIESFVRYYMTFVDGIIVVDHNSDDDTGKILYELQKEYPSLIVDKITTIEHIQSEVMTNLVKIAANELGADWVLPLDIDEYLIPKDGADCRSILSRITDDVISLNWIEHELVDTENDRDVFLLNRLCNRSSTVNFMTKILLKGSFVRNTKIRLIQGNHGVMKIAENGSESLAYAPRCSDFILAHFPFRSREQYVSKHAIGWLTSAMKYSVTTIAATNWKRAFDRIRDNDYEIPKITDAQFVGRLYDKNITLRYTDSRPINVLSRVMTLAEKICDNYAKQVAVTKISTITVIMPVDDDIDAAVDTIGSLLSQTIQDWKLVVIAPDDMDENVRTTLIECDARISVVGIHNNIKPEGFIKLISPGRKLSSDCLEKEAIALEIHREFNINVTYSNGKDAMGADVVVDHFCAQDGTDIWNGIKDTPYSLTGGVSGVMLRNIPQDLQLPEVIENYRWKEKEILGKLLPGRLFLVFAERFV